MSFGERRGPSLRFNEESLVDQYVKDDDLRVQRRLSRPACFLAPNRVVHPPSWLGHLPFAFWIVDVLRPRTLVELGAHTGNSYSAFCQAADLFKTGSACYAVDTWEGDPQAGYYGDEIYNDLAAHHDPRYGSFSRLLRMTFDAAADHFAPGSIDLLHIDGLHTYDAVRCDFETWLPKMSRRGVILFHDVNVRKDDFGVWKLWEEISADRPHFTFLHSNGLGVLGVGDEFPDDVRWLFGAQDDAGEIRDFFERLGRTPVLTEALDNVSKSKRHLETEVAQVRAALDGVVDHNGALKNMLASKDGDIAALQSALADMQAGRDAVLAERNETVAIRDRDIALIQGWLQEHQAEVGRLAAENTALASQNAEKEQAVAAHLADIAAHQDAVRHYRSVVDALYASTSWKVARPVRALGRIKAQFERFYRSRRHDIALEPMHDVKPVGDGFESTGGDPAFRLRSHRGAMPGGWCIVSYRIVNSSAPLIPSLYVDDGSGFSELRTIRLPAGATGLVQQLVLLPPSIAGLRFDPTNRPAQFMITDFAIREIGKINLLAACLRHKQWHPLRALLYLRQHGWAATKQRVIQELLPIHRLSDYDSWVKLFDQLSGEDVVCIRADIGQLPSQPLISIVMPAYNSPADYLRRAIDTVRGQLYENWELCVVDDASPQPHVTKILTEYAARDKRIKFTRREANGHIAAASNTALELASGDFVALMDHDDELPPHALYMVAKELAAHPSADIIYSDEDKVDENGKRYDPYFKSDYNPDLLHGQNMFNHLTVYRRDLLTRLGGFRVGFEGSQDYDLVLRAVEATTPERIRHIPFILYHWRVFSHSSAFSTINLDKATDAARRALREHFERRGLPVSVEESPATNRFTRVRYPVPTPEPKVSLIIPTRDRVELLRGCVDGILHRTDYRNIEVVIVDNDSEHPETLAYFDSLKGDPRVRVIPYHGKFNYSAINNFAVAQATGDIIGLINNDIEVIGGGWLSEMVSHAVRPEVGAVGAKLLYAEGSVQHAGVITGICGVAGHAQKHADRHDFGYFSRLQLTHNLSCVTAACLLMRRSVFDQVGRLDEAHLAVAFNDVDLCLRVREAGYLLVWTPFAELYHLESASRGPDTAPDKIHRFMREIDYMNRRWGESLQHDPYYNPNLTLDAEDYSLAFPPRVVKPWYSKQSA